MASGKYCILLTPDIKKAANLIGISPEVLRAQILTWQKDTGLSFDEQYNKQKIKTILLIVDHARQKFLKKYKLSDSNLLSAYRKVNQDFSPLELKDAILFVIRLINQNYDSYRRSGEEFNGTREDYYATREDKILKSVRRDINVCFRYPKGARLPFLNEKGANIIANKKQVELIGKLLKDFDAIWQLSKLKLKSDYGLKLGLDNNTPISEDLEISDEEIERLLDTITESVENGEIGANDPEATFDYELSVKEAWQEVKEFLKPMKQLSAETRRMLSSIPQYDNNGNMILSTFGIPRYDSPSNIHKKLVVNMYDIRSESGMMRRLEQMSAEGDMQMEHIIGIVDADNVLQSDKFTEEEKERRAGDARRMRTVLKQDLDNTAMMYVVDKIKRKAGRIIHKLVPINTTSSQIGKRLWKQYKTLLSYDEIALNVNKAVFNQKGKFKANGISSLKLGMGYFSQYVSGEGTDYDERTSTYFTKVSKQNQIADITKFLTQLGIPYNYNAISRLINSKSDEKKVLISNIFDVLKFITDRSPDALLNSTIYQVLTTSPSTNTSYTIDTAMSQIMRIINSGNYYTLQTFRAFGSFMNPNKGYVEYQTAQKRGFLTDFFADIREAIEKTESPNNKEKKNYLKELIEKRFFNDPMFVEFKERKKDKDGNYTEPPQWVEESPGVPVIRCQWLKELYKSNLSNPNCFAKRFLHYLLIGSEKDNSDNYATTSNSDSQTFEDFNGILYISTLFQAFVNYNQGSYEFKGTSGRDYADYPTFILGDSGKQKFIRAKKYNPDIMIPLLRETVMQEIEFIKNAESFNRSLELQGYNKVMFLERNLRYGEGKNAFYKFCTFPELNEKIEESMLSIEGVENMTAEELEDQRMNLLISNLDTWLKKIMDARFERFKEKCQRDGVLETTEQRRKNEDGEEITYLVYKHLPLSNENGYPQKLDSSDASIADNEKQRDKFLKDFYWNSTFAMIQQIQLTTRTPMFYRDVLEMQKRMKQMHASGKRPSLEAVDYDGNKYMLRDGRDDTSFNFIELYDVVGNPRFSGNGEFMDAVAYTHGINTQEFQDWQRNHPEATEEEITNKRIESGKTTTAYLNHSNTSYTDGQGVRTLEAYRKVMGALGKWSRLDELYYKRIQEIRKGHQDGSEWTKEEMLEISEMLSRWQPIKPFGFGFESKLLNDKGVGCKIDIPVQIKCSECLLIPELLPKDSRMRIVVEYLEDLHIDCAYFDSCIKEGAYGLGECFYKKVGSNGKKDILPEVIGPEELRQNLYGLAITDENSNTVYKPIAGKTPFVHKMSYNDWVELSNVPEHTYSSRTIGTQLRKIFFDGLSELSDYSKYVGRNLIKINGKDHSLQSKEALVKFYSALHCANVKAQFEAISNIITKDQTLSEELQKIAMRNSNESMQKMVLYAAHKVLVDDEERTEFPIPLFENSLEHDAAASIISLFKKASTLLQIEGGSLVQASAFGITKMELIDDKIQESDLKVKCKNHNILESECEVPFSGEYTDKYGVKHKLRYKDYVNPDGTLIMEGNVSKLEKHFPGSTTMICYRIPSEKSYSAVVLKVKRFTKPVEGGIIRLPVLITSITGADFDIDKMFLMRKQFVQHHNAKTQDEVIEEAYSDSDLNKIWGEVYDGQYNTVSGQSIKRALEEARQILISEGGNDDRGKPVTKNTPLIRCWSKAVKERPAFFRGFDGLLHTNKQDFFDQAALKLNIKPKEVDNTDKVFKFYEYDYGRNPEKQFRNRKLDHKRGIKTDVVVRNNMMLLLVIARLQDPETMLSRTTPGGFEDVKIGAADLRFLGILDESEIQQFYTKDSQGNSIFNWKAFREYQAKNKDKDPVTNLDYADPYTLVEFNKQNLIAAKLVGTFANLNSFKQMFGSVYDVLLSKPIKMFGRTVTSLARDKDGRDSSLYVAELLAAAVDSVKNPTLKFLNVTQSTAYVAGLMAMAGFTHTEIGVLLNQPIVRKITDYCELNHCGLTTAINKMKEEYFKDRKPNSNYESDLTEENLINCLVGGDNTDFMIKNKDDFDFMNKQFSVLQALTHLTNVSLNLKLYNAAAKMTSANSILSSFGSLYNIVQSAEAIANLTDENKHIKIIRGKDNQEESSVIDVNLNIDDDDYMSKVLESAFPIEQVIYDAAKSMINKMQKYFPYGNTLFKAAREFFRNLTKDKVLTAKTIDLIHHDVQAYALSVMPNCLFSDAQIDVNGKSMSARNYFLHEFPTLFGQFLSENAEKYPTMYRCLEVDRDNSTINLSFSFDREADKDGFTLEWRLMINEFRKNPNGGLNVGEALYFYNFHASGFNFTSTSFDYLFPSDCLSEITVGFIGNENITYKDVLDYIKKGDYKLSDRFYIQFFQQHADNSEVVKQIYNYKDASNFRGAVVEISTSNLNADDDYKFLQLKTNKEGTIEFPAAINARGSLYIAEVGGQINNIVPQGGIIKYRKYSTLGTEYGVKENDRFDNPPLDGNFLEPISWVELETNSIKFNDRINLDFVNFFENSIVEALKDNGFNADLMRDLLEYATDLKNAVRQRPVSIDTFTIAHSTYDAISTGFKAYNEGRPLTNEQIQLFKLINLKVILLTFVDVICPGINQLSGEARAEIYNIIYNNFSGIDLQSSDYTLDDIRSKVITSLIDNKLAITQVIETVEQGRNILGVILNNTGKNPLFRTENNEIIQKCR